MKYKILLSIVLTCVVVSSALGNDSFEGKIKKLKKEQGQQHVVIDDKTWKEIDSFLVDNESVSVRDFKKMRLVGVASEVALDDLNEKYGANADNYQVKIKDEHKKKVYKLAQKMAKKWNYREFYACKNDDENEALRSWGNVDSIRERIAEKYRKKERNSDDMIKLREQVINECSFSETYIELLGAYKARAINEKYNKLMLRIIADDQVNYDYLYDGMDTTNNSFVLSYIAFLTEVNGQKEKSTLSKEQVKVIAESLLAKEQGVFNMRNSTFYSQEDNFYYDSIVYDGVRALINMSTWLKEYQLNDLNNKFIDRFIMDDLVKNTIQAQPSFSGYWQYLQSRGTVSK